MNLNLKHPVSSWTIVVLAATPYWFYLTVSDLFITFQTVSLVGELESTAEVGVAAAPARVVQHLLMFCLSSLGYLAASNMPRNWPLLNSVIVNLLIAGLVASFGRAALNVGLVSVPQGPWIEYRSVMLEQWGLRPWLYGGWAAWSRSALEWLFNYSVGLGLVFGLRLWLDLDQQRRVADRLREEWLRSRLEALHNRLNPHFLFNSLHTASALVESDPARARLALSSLSDMLRSVLRDTPEGLWTMGEELALIRSHIALESLRFGDGLRFLERIDPAGRTAVVPCFVLQPVVENAIKHGAAHGVAKVTIMLRIKRDDVNQRLRLEVENDRVGEVGESRTGFGEGLRTLRERLEVYYDGRAGLESGPDGHGGWRTTILIPLGSTQGVDDVAA